MTARSRFWDPCRMCLTCPTDEALFTLPRRCNGREALGSPVNRRSQQQPAASAEVDDGGDGAAAVGTLVGGRDGDEHGRVAGDRGGDPADGGLDLPVPVNVGVVEHRVTAAADVTV